MLHASGEPTKETLCSIYDIDDAEVGATTVNQLASDLQDPGLPPEVNRLGRTIWRWRTQIAKLARRSGNQRGHRGRQQPHQTGQARRVRVHQLRELPDPGPAVCRQTQLGSARHPHLDLDAESCQSSVRPPPAQCDGDGSASMEFGIGGVLPDVVELLPGCPT